MWSQIKNIDQLKNNNKIRFSFFDQNQKEITTDYIIRLIKTHYITAESIELCNVVIQENKRKIITIPMKILFRDYRILV